MLDDGRTSFWVIGTAKVGGISKRPSVTSVRDRRTISRRSLLIYLPYNLGQKRTNTKLAVVSFSRVVKNGSVVSILRVLTKRGGDDEKTGGVSTEIR
jgi:hypothetical protein